VCVCFGALLEKLIQEKIKPHERAFSWVEMPWNWFDFEEPRNTPRAITQNAKLHVATIKRTNSSNTHPKKGKINPLGDKKKKRVI